MRIVIHELNNGFDLRIWDDRAKEIKRHEGIDYVDAVTMVCKALEKWNAQGDNNGDTIRE
jgi:hypothetical protein